uniref:Uncharacterized protein n=1 Tax=Avena sativa TaxID=4498 RepID=A0ACD5X9R4_AVESA
MDAGGGDGNGLCFPYDVLLHILCQLPERDLARSRCICRTWRAIVNTHKFILRFPYFFPRHAFAGIFFSKVGYESSTSFFAPPGSPRLFYPHEATVRQSCNGLLLLEYGNNYYVLNPETTRFAHLPRLTPPLFVDAMSLAFDPAVSLHYDVFFLQKGMLAEPKEGEVPPLDKQQGEVVEEPMKKVVPLLVYSSRTGQWDNREFVPGRCAPGNLYDALTIKSMVRWGIVRSSTGPVNITKDDDYDNVGDDDDDDDDDDDEEEEGEEEEEDDDDDADDDDYDDEGDGYGYSWNSDEDNFIDVDGSAPNLGPPTWGHYCGIVGFHPHKNAVILIIRFAVVVYHLDTSRMQYLGNEHELMRDPVQHCCSMEGSFTYRPCYEDVLAPGPQISMTRQSNLLQAIRASRKRRGVVGEEQDEELLRNDVQAEDEEEEENEDFTQPGSHVETTNGRIWTPRGANSIPPAPPTHAAKIALIPSGDRNWLEAQFNKKDRVPNTILGSLLRHYYPQIVMDT